jgi:hypothetical protein
MLKSFVTIFSAFSHITFPSLILIRRKKSEARNPTLASSCQKEEDKKAKKNSIMPLYTLIKDNNLG